MLTVAAVAWFFSDGIEILKYIFPVLQMMSRFPQCTINGTSDNTNKE